MRNLAFLSIVLFALGACQQSATSLVAVNSNLDNYSNAKLQWGESVNVEMETSNHDSIQLQLNGKKVSGSNVILSNENSVLGRNILSLAVFTGEEITTREVTLLIVSSQKAELKSYPVIKTYKHDASYFTEGFYYDDGLIYEGTGLNGKSKLVAYNLASAKIEKSIDIDAQYFGEGIAVVGDSIFQLTYKAQKAFIYNRTTFEKVGEFSVPFSAEGWGLCYDGKNLVMSNGSHYLYFIDPKNLTYTASLQVVDDKGIRGKLNELEYHNGKIYANVWYEKEIVVINPETGAVEEVISLDEIPAKSFRQGVANGIATKDGNLLVTGKNWEETYELQISGL